MSMIRSISAAWLCVLCVIALASPAPAQEITDEEQQEDIVSLARQRQRPQWDASIVTSWLPDGGIHGSGGELSMEEVKVVIGRRFTLTPRMELSTSLRYALQNIDAPDDARLPGSLQAIALTLGGDYRSTDQLTLGLSISPGLSSDFRAVSSGDVRVPVAFKARYQSSPGLTYLGGLVYTSGSHAFRVWPLVGILYMPSEKWAFALGFPRTGVMYQPRKGLEFSLGAESGAGEYHLHDPSLGANVISYRDFRGVAGVDVALASFAKLGFSGGYAFDRRFIFYEGSRDDVRLDSVPFGKMEIKFAW